MHIVRLGLLAVAPLLLLGARGLAQDASGPSFDCAQAKGVIEQSICHDPALARADRTMARLYAAAKTSAFGAGPANLLPGQRKWLKEREDCVDYARAYKSREQCLAGSYAGRNHDLAVAALFADAPLALATLRETDPEMAPLYEAVLVYASHPGDNWSNPALAQDRARLLALLRPKVALLQSDEMRSYGRDILKDEKIERAEDVFAVEDGFGELLAVLATYEDGRYNPMTMPCAAIVRRPELWTATLAKFGSTLDNFVPSPDCETTLPPLPELDALVARIYAGWPACEGTIRFSAYRGFAAMVSAARLGSDVGPGSKPGPAGKPLPRLKGVPPAAAAAATAELATYYVTYRHSSPVAAQSAARDAIRSILDDGHDCGEGEG